MAGASKCTPNIRGQDVDQTGRPDFSERADDTPQSGKLSNEPNFQTLSRTWATESSSDLPQQTRSTFASGAGPETDHGVRGEVYNPMQRWEAETMEKQPWNGIGEFATTNAKEH
ncbi:MAG: hypothetical protein M1827_005757 [Pycnora praestabilis]|nr:MAG: hypothetical protein M1827_005757 [Pycnora praestabilis]